MLAGDLSEVNLATDSGKMRWLLSVPSLDTPVCDTEAKRFNTEATGFPENVVVYTISCDLPFALGRWCAAANATNIKALSDHRDLSFDDAYGTHNEDFRLLSRAVFLVDQNDIIQYVQYVREVGEQPDYDAALTAVQNLAG